MENAIFSDLLALPRGFWRTVNLLLTVCVLSVLVIGVPARAQDSDDEPTPIRDARQATVFLMQTYDAEGVQVLSCVGSGTIIDSSGLILTNAHLATAIGPCQGERIVVALPVRLDEPPVPTYIAEIITADILYDLAILQIIGGLDGSLVEPTTLNLPSVQIGDPAGLLPGNTLTFVGYPDTGISSVTATNALITGTTSEGAEGGLSWLRTETILSGGISGGGAYDINGRLVGIPTSAPFSDGIIHNENCLAIQDNTRDGLISDRDACVPIGAGITQTRPITFALPLIELARNDFTLQHKAGLPETALLETPRINRVFFSVGTAISGTPPQIVSSAPSGTTSLSFWFEYRNLRDGTPYALKVTRDGIDMNQFSLGPLAWGGGRDGIWQIGTSDLTWPDGNYEFSLLLGSSPISTTTFIVGGAASAPGFRDLVLSSPEVESVTIGSRLLASEVTQVDGAFLFRNMPQGQDWTEVWYLDGAEVFNATRLWERESDGQMRVSAVNLEGLPLGTYKLDLFIGDTLAATSSVTLAGGTTTGGLPLIFTNPRMANDISRDGLPAGEIGTAMPLGINDLYLFVDWDLLPPGLTWTYRWYLDGRLIATSTQPWNAGSVGQDFWVNLHSDDPLPEGTYAAEFLLENVPMFSSSVSIGSGTQPISGTEAESDEVFLSGQIVDALTGNGIPNALIIVLDVRFESPDFVWDESQIHTQAITDERGFFEFPRGLPRSNFYTVYTFADGYLTVLEDNFWIFGSTPSPTEIKIEMTRP